MYVVLKLKDSSPKSEEGTVALTTGRLTKAVGEAVAERPASVIWIDHDKTRDEDGANELIVFVSTLGAIIWHSADAHAECTKRGIPGVD